MHSHINESHNILCVVAYLAVSVAKPTSAAYHALLFGVWQVCDAHNKISHIQHRDIRISSQLRLVVDNVLE